MAFSSFRDSANCSFNCHQPLHLLAKRLAIVLDLFGPDVAAGRQDVAVLANLVDRGRLAEAGNILVLLSSGSP